MSRLARARNLLVQRIGMAGKGKARGGMNKPPSWTSREESLLLLNAYLDNELDAASVLDVERRIGSDATLKAELARLLELRNALSTHVGKERASDALRRRVAAIADTSKGLTVWRSLEATSNGTVASKARW
jgi:hypothetical protein